MPGFDGSGPNGRGPMTGGGRGDCIRETSPEERRSLGMGRGGVPRFLRRRHGRRGRGRGMGLGGGMW